VLALPAAVSPDAPVVSLLLLELPHAASERVHAATRRALNTFLIFILLILLKIFVASRRMFIHYECILTSYIFYHVFRKKLV
jgi:hypothetical protein